MHPSVRRLAQQASQQKLTPFQQAWKTWYEPAAIPIYVVIGVAVGGAGWYLTRLARGPDVVWDRKGNPHPWLHVGANDNTKMHSVSHQFDKSWSRDRF